MISWKSPSPDSRLGRKIKNGGERGIRTLDTCYRIHAFQACAFSHSAISPQGWCSAEPSEVHQPIGFLKDGFPACPASCCGAAKAPWVGIRSLNSARVGAETGSVCRPRTRLNCESSRCAGSQPRRPRPARPRWRRPGWSPAPVQSSRSGHAHNRGTTAAH